MSRDRDGFGAKSVAGLWGEPGIPLWQRVAAYAFSLGFVVFWLLIWVIFESDENAMQERYEGLRDCDGTHAVQCIRYVPGEMHSSGTSGRGGHTSKWRPSGGDGGGYPVYVRLSKIDDEARGMFVDREFVGVEDASGKRFPAMGDAGNPLLWFSALGSILACIVGCVAISRWGRLPSPGVKEDPDSLAR